MTERIAIKSLTASDLTFFESIFKRSSVGNQKAINLNADVFAQILYPEYTKIEAEDQPEAEVDITLFGPASTKPYHVQRSITKKGSYKNWRLNGAFVPDPHDEPGRFDVMAAKDIAIMEFLGDPIPKAIRIALIARALDPELHAALSKDTSLGRKTMSATSRIQLLDLTSPFELGETHPISSLLFDQDLEEEIQDAIYGAAPAVRNLRQRRGRKLLKDELATAKRRAETVGEDGEALAFQYLTSSAQSAELSNVVWTSQNDAACSWDFESTVPQTVRFDAKSTAGRFEANIHMSGAEVAAAADPSIPYRIVRVNDLSELGGYVTVSENINEFARLIFDNSATFPAGVLPESFLIRPKCFRWGTKIWVPRSK